MLVVLGALAAPVAILVHRSAEDELRARLDERAASLAAAFDPVVTGGGQIGASDLAVLLGPGEGARIVDATGVTVVERDPLVDGGTLSASRPLVDGSRLVVVAGTAELQARFRNQMLTLLALAGGALLAAAALAAIQARQLARPLERLAKTAGRLGDGDFSVPAPPPTDIAEIDRIAEALARSGRRIDETLASERHFTADATHQLRTALTGLAMRFEILARHTDPAVTEEARAGLDQVDQLDETIDELLTVTRERTTRERTRFDLVGLVEDHAVEWRRRAATTRREIRVVHDGPVEVVGTKGLAGQIVDVLVDNALRHGAGAVTVSILSSADGPSLEVADEGTGFGGDDPTALFRPPDDPAAPHGRGLGLARRLARADGGALEIVTLRPATVRYRPLPAYPDG